MSAVIDIGSRRQLFADPHLVDQLDGTQLVLHRPQPQEMALQCDLPWELSEPGYPTVFHDGDRYRLYYRIIPPAADDSDADQITCYAESADGIHWEKPELELHEAAGHQRTNILWRGVIAHNLTPFVDANPQCPAEQRYKAVGGHKWGTDGLWGLVSPDGLHWRKLGDKPLDLAGNFDSQNLVFWDPVEGLYRAYWRDHRRGDARIPDGRDVRTAVSEDFVHWSAAEWLDYQPNRSGSTEPDQSDDPTGDHHQFYCSGVRPYYRAPELVLGFPQRYVDRGWTASTDFLPDIEERRALAELGVGGGRPTREGTMVTDILFMAGRDRRRFFVWPEALVRPGVQRPGSWNYSDTWCAWGLVETASRYAGAPPELSLYVQEKAQRHGPGGLRRHALRLDGFVSAYADLRGGRLVTQPLRFAGGRLEINFSSSAGGRLRVEIQDEQGRALPGFGLDDCPLLYGDQIDRPVAWQRGADIGGLAGRPVRLCFELKDADLFSFNFH